MYNRPLFNYIFEKWNGQDVLSLSDMLLSIVEVRRYIEEFHRGDNKYGVAKFYCDWVLHSKMDRNDYAQNALEIINRNLRNPNLPYDNPSVYSQTIVNALQYGKAGVQIGHVITEITRSSFTVDNQFMQTLMMCMVGIPFAPLQGQNAEQRRKTTDSEIEQECVRWNQRCPKAILTNMFTYIDSMKRIENFVITNISGAHWDMELMLEGGEKRYCFIEIGTLV